MVSRDTSRAPANRPHTRQLREQLQAVAGSFSTAPIACQGHGRLGSPGRAGRLACAAGAGWAAGGGGGGGGGSCGSVGDRRRDGGLGGCCGSACHCGMLAAGPATLGAAPRPLQAQLHLELTRPLGSAGASWLKTSWRGAQHGHAGGEGPAVGGQARQGGAAAAAAARSQPARPGSKHRPVRVQDAGARQALLQTAAP